MPLTEGITWITMMWNVDNGPLSWARRTISSAMMTKGLRTMLYFTRCLSPAMSCSGTILTGSPMSLAGQETIWMKRKLHNFCHTNTKNPGNNLGIF